MFDNITLQLNEFSNSDFEKMCRFTGVSYAIDSSAVKVDWQNLRLVYHPDSNILFIKNSIHKFYNAVYNEVIGRPVNHNDFNRFHLLCVADFLSEVVFQRPMADFKVLAKFEYGVNIDTGQYAPFEITERWLSYIYSATNSYYTVAPSRGKPFSRTCYLTDYRVKAYDKGKEAGLTGINLLRYEIALNGLKKLRDILKLSEVSLQELTVYDTWDSLFNHLLLVYDKTYKLPFISEIGNTSVDDILTLHAYCNKLTRNDLKMALGDSQYKRLIEKYKQMYEQYSNNPENIHNQVRQKIIEKYYDLVLPCASLQP